MKEIIYKCSRKIQNPFENVRTSGLRVFKSSMKEYGFYYYERLEDENDL